MSSKRGRNAGATQAHASTKRSCQSVSGFSAFAVAMMGLSPLTLAVRSAIAGVDANGGANTSAVADDEVREVIVTGTRDVGVKARDSAAPIEVVSAAQLQATGATNAFDALKTLVPSFSASAQGVDTDNIVRSARLRGMNPGEVLVLVNGKRRHDTAVVTYYQSPNSPSNAADLDMIPISLIDHIEVLLDGAAAQYGSDAVAGVINIILKESNSAGLATADTGITSRGDGARWSGTANHGFELPNNGFFNVSAETQKRSFEYRGGIDVLSVGQTDPFGTVLPAARNNHWGTPQFDLTTIGFNSSIPITDDVALYGDATAGHRTAAYWDNDRRADKIPAVYPYGFTPQQTLRENDFEVTLGLKGSIASWDWDLSATDGRDQVALKVVNTINIGLYDGTNGAVAFTGGSLGTLLNRMTTVNADTRRAFDIGLTSPLNVAVGGEYRDENFVVTAGEPGTWEAGGTSAEAGFTPLDASDHSRRVKAGYLELSNKPVSMWKIDAAGRYESYSDSGSTVTGKITNRVDFTEQFAVRATYSTGFHAPTLAQEYFSSTSIQPTTVTFQAPPTSPGAAFLGASPLKPEKSADISFGLVAEPFHGLHLSIDAYQIKLNHRIIDSAQIGGPLALQAATLNNPSFVVEPGSTAFFAFFNNAIDTRTRGVELSADYKTDFDAYGVLLYQLNANFNKTTILNEAAVPANMAAALAAAGQSISYLNPQVVTDITKSSPSAKVSLALNWKISSWSVNLRETYYGQVHQNSGNTSAVVAFTDIPVKAAVITDLDIGWDVSERVHLDVGSNNLLDVMPDRITPAQSAPRQSQLYSSYTPWGIDGAFFYGRVSVKF
jgi:iron complex outermembrane recepter protein